MGSLGLAGVISGAGEGASKALTMAQAQYGAERLQAARDEGDNNRQARLLEAQKAMHSETIEAQKSEGAATRKVTQEEGAATRKSAEGIHTEAVTAQQDIASKQNISQEKIAKTAADSHLEIAKLTNQMHENVAKLQRDMQTKQFDKTFTAAKMTATTAALKDLSDQMIHLNQAVSNPLADKTSPEYKSAVEILQKAQRLHMVYQQQLADMISSGPGGLPATPNFPGKVEAAQTPTSLPPFVPPPMNAPGLAQTPAPIQGRPY